MHFFAAEKKKSAHNGMEFEKNAYLCAVFRMRHKHFGCSIASRTCTSVKQKEQISNIRRTHVIGVGNPIGYWRLCKA